MDDTRDLARSKVQHKTGRHGDPHLPHLAASIRSSVTQRGASLRSSEVYGPAQNYGGHVGRGHASLLRPQLFMTEAVREEKPRISARLEGLLDDLARKYSEG